MFAWLIAHSRNQWASYHCAVKITLRQADLLWLKPCQNQPETLAIQSICIAMMDCGTAKTPGEPIHHQQLFLALGTLIWYTLKKRNTSNGDNPDE